jgi:UDP-glucose 4-epimerase
MKILVTGGAGFIGSHVVDAYLEEGHAVVVADDLSTGRREQVNPRAQFYQVGIGDDELKEVFRRERPQVINHHAAQMDVRRSVSDPLFDARVNILGLIHVMERAREFGVKKVIFASSGGAIYGDSQDLPSSEESLERPQSPYGISKLAGEHYLYYYHAVYSIPYIALRYANVYGPRQNPHGEAGVVAIFTQKLLEARTPIIYGDGLQTRDYVYVEDVARANLLALNSNAIGCLNIGTGKETDVITLFAHLKEKIGSRANECHGPRKDGEQQRSVLSPFLAEKVLDWKAEVSLDEGLDLTVCFFREEIALSSGSARQSGGRD